MCNYSGRLIAWLDRELPENEAADLERHVGTCAECRSEVDLYSRVSRAFDAYCDAASDSFNASTTPRGLPRWIPLFSGAAAAAAVALVAIFLRAPAAKPRLHAQAAVTTAAVAPAPIPHAISGITPPNITIKSNRAIKKIRRRHVVAAVQKYNAVGGPTEPAIQIAIPAEAMYPPGAVPEGVNFIADVNIGVDGSVQGLRLRPRLAGFERRPTQP